MREVKARSADEGKISPFLSFHTGGNIVATKETESLRSQIEFDHVRDRRTKPHAESQFEPSDIRRILRLCVTSERLVEVVELHLVLDRIYWEEFEHILRGSLEKPFESHLSGELSILPDVRPGSIEVAWRRRFGFLHMAMFEAMISEVVCVLRLTVQFCL